MVEKAHRGIPQHECGGVTCRISAVNPRMSLPHTPSEIPAPQPLIALVQGTP